MVARDGLRILVRSPSPPRVVRRDDSRSCEQRHVGDGAPREPRRAHAGCRPCSTRSPAQTRTPDERRSPSTPAVTDESPDLLRQRLGDDGAGRGRRATPATPPPSRAAWRRCPAGARRGAWVWLLHDDSAPAPDALAQLLARAADAQPGVDILGPEAARVALPAPAPRGRRHDQRHRPARDRASSAASTTRASTTGSATCSRSTPPGCSCAARCWRALGLRRAGCRLFGNDLDFGWRAARAGHRTLVVPEAVVFHVEAAHRGVRRTALSGRHVRRGRASGGSVHAADQHLAALAAVRLAQAAARHQPGPRPRAARWSGRPGRPRDEMSALARVYLRPGPDPRRAPTASPAPRRSRTATYATSSRRGGCPTGTAWTSSPTSPSP